MLVGQLDFYLDAHLRQRLVGLTGEEYLWKPVEGCWSLRDVDGAWTFERCWRGRSHLPASGAGLPGW